MKTLTLCVHGEKDTELLKKLIENAKFNDEIEVYEDEDEFTDEDIEEFDRRMAEYEKDPFKGKSVDEVMKALKEKQNL